MPKDVLIQSCSEHLIERPKIFCAALQLQKNAARVRGGSMLMNVFHE